MRRRVLYLGGNGHATARLAAARAALARLAAAGQVADLEIVEVPYPGFEDRPPAADREAFLAAVGAALQRELDDPDGAAARTLVYGTGIGGLIGLALRARGVGLGTPFVVQGAVLWGLERRRMPALARRGAAVWIARLLQVRWVQRWFARRQFLRRLDDDERAAFFDGYARCTSMAALFDWFTPELLRTLERELAARPAAHDGITLWHGVHDRVVDETEFARTFEALGVRWPVHRFPDWAHYPMIDDPDGWIRALDRELADTPQRVL